MTFRAHNQSGFTLIELLIGLVLFIVTAVTVTALIINSGESTKKNLSAAQQNSMVRSAMEQIRRDLAEADQFITMQCTLPSPSSCGMTGTSGAAGGNQITFVRKAPAGSGGGYTYIPERITYHTAAQTDAQLRYAVTVQQGPRSDKSAAVAFAGSASNWTTAKHRVLIDKILASDSTPIFRYYETATKVVPSEFSDVQRVEATQLVDLTLKRDEDLDVTDNDSAAVGEAESNRLNPTAKIATSIYLTGTATQGRGGGGDQLSC